jgi:transposase-like protein
MTSQTKCFIELTDIVAIRLNCRKCKASITLPFSGYRDMPYVCPNCEAQFSEFNDKVVKGTISELVRCVNNVVKLTAEGGFSFRLEIVPFT